MSIAYIPFADLIDQLNDANSSAERYRLAWTSARQRAAAYADEIDDAHGECAHLKALLVDAYQIADGLKVERDAAFKRANEAARLSAEARDQADDLRRQIEDLREHVAIVEGDRTDTDIWALNVVAEHGIEHEIPDLLAAIAAYIRECRQTIADYRHYGDKAVEAREWYANQAEQLAAERDEARAEVERVNEHAKAVRVYAAERQDERNEARAEVVRLGRRLEEIRAEGIEALEREL